ncbi:MAG: DUF3667 domain-containing protein [Williamsia sp.]|nr:DUF3667 domain-containing protein [Williamsia sp.]
MHRLTLHDILHDAVHYFVHVDRGFLQLLKSLATQTGVVAREYVSGKRRKYFPPLNFFLVAAAVYVFAQSMYAHHTPAAGAEDWRPSVLRIPDPVTRQYVSRIYERKDLITKVTSKYSNVIYMIATPFLTLIIWLFYSRGRYNYTEHLIASLYITGFCALFYAAVVAPLSLVPWLEKYKVGLTLYFLFEICYRAVFYNRFINEPTTGAILKNWLIALFIVAFWAVFSVGIFYLYIRDGLFGLFH